MNIFKYFFLPISIVYAIPNINIPFSLKKIFNNLIIKTEPKLNINNFIGQWYQAATSRSTKLLGTGVDYYDVKATYSCIDNCTTNNISVINDGINGNNLYTNISGFSYCLNNSLASKRKLKFYNLPFIGNYWIVKLGPVINNQYQYVIVSGPLTTFFGTRFSLYVLCRDIDDYKNNYREYVMDWCKQNGFIYYWNEYVETI